MGTIIGPVIGGALARPAKQYPNQFSEKSFFGQFPCNFFGKIYFIFYFRCFTSNYFFRNVNSFICFNIYLFTRNRKVRNSIFLTFLILIFF